MASNQTPKSGAESKKGFFVLNPNSVVQTKPSLTVTSINRQLSSQIQGKSQATILPQVGQTFSASQLPQGQIIFIPSSEEVRVPSHLGQVIFPGNSNTVQSPGSRLTSTPVKRWSNEETKLIVKSYRQNSENLHSIKSSRGKKTVWENIYSQFCKYCIEEGLPVSKTLVQAKEKCRSLIDKYKFINENDQSVSWKFEFYDIFHEIFNPKEVTRENETGESKPVSKLNTELESNSESEEELDSPQGTHTLCPNITDEDTPYTVLLGDQPCVVAYTDPSAENKDADTSSSSIPKPTKNLANREMVDMSDNEEPKMKKRKVAQTSTDSLQTIESAIVGMLNAQQKIFEQAERKDEKMLKIMETMLQLYADGERRHQEFMVSVLDKIQAIFTAKQ